MTVPLDRSEAGGRRSLDVFLIGTGTLATAHLPFWLNWLRANRPAYRVTIGLTEAARGFVSATALAALTGRPVIGNAWDDDPSGTAPVHVDLAAGYDALLVYPASTSFITQVASAFADRPFQLALLGTGAPVVFAPSLPPGVERNPLVQDAVARVAQVPNFFVVDPVPGTSERTGEKTATAAPLWDVIAVLEHRLFANRIDLDESA